MYLINKYIFKNLNIILVRLLGIGDWGLGIGPNPQSPIPNPHINVLNYLIKIIKFIL